MSIINEKFVHDELRDKQISRADAIQYLIELRYPAVEAMQIVDEWIDGWDFQKDYDEEREQGWSR